MSSLIANIDRTVYTIASKKGENSMFLELFFRNHFFIFNLSKTFFRIKVAEETFRQLLLKVQCLLHKQSFVFLYEDFAIN